MDGQNFENEQNQQNGGTVEGTVGNTDTYQYDSSVYTGSYMDNSSAYSSDVYSSSMPETEGETPGLATAALVFGIIGIVTCCCGCLSVLCGIAGLVMAIVANSKQKSNVGTAALICSIVALVIGIIASCIELPVLLPLLFA